MLMVSRPLRVRSFPSKPKCKLFIIYLCLSFLDGKVCTAQNCKHCLYKYKHTIGIKVVCLFIWFGFVLFCFIIFKILRKRKQKFFFFLLLLIRYKRTSFIKVTFLRCSFVFMDALFMVEKMRSRSFWFPFKMIYDPKNMLSYLLTDLCLLAQM